MAENDHKYFEKRKDERETIHRARFVTIFCANRAASGYYDSGNKRWINVTCTRYIGARFYARGCVHLVGVLYRSTWQGIKGVRWVAILSGSSRAFYSPPPPSFLPLRSLFLRSLQVTRRDMEIIWRIIIVLDQMRLISTPRAKRIRSRESRICESCAASGSQVCYYQRVMKIFFIFVVRVEDRFLCVYFFEKKKRILRNKFFFFFFKFVEVIAKK